MTKTKNERMPLYKKISGQLRAQCLASAGEMLPSLRQLSVDLEVNHATVSRALRDLEREGVVEIVPRKGIFSVARPPVTANIEFVVLVNDKANLLDVALRMSRGMEEHCRRLSARGNALQTTRTLLDESVWPVAEEFVAEARERGTVGIIFLGFGYLEGAEAQAETDFIAAVAQKIPVVLAGSPHQTLDVDCVLGDPNSQMREFLEHCYQNGARRFEYLGEQSNNLLQRERREVFSDFLEQHGLQWQWDAMHQHRGAQLEAELRALTELPAVVVATNLYRAFTIALEAQRRGLQLPAELQILCFASVPADAQPLLPYASVITIDEVEVGARAAQLLGRQIAEGLGKDPHTERVPARFSSGPLCSSELLGPDAS